MGPPTLLYLLLLLIAVTTFFTPSISISADDSVFLNGLEPDIITGNQTIVSASGVFELGFFSPDGDDGKTYLGIWYANIPVRTVVWVANRQNPVIDSPGVLKLSPDGCLVILDAQEATVWSSAAPTVNISWATTQLLDDGNFVLMSTDLSGTPESVAWQSFDYPTDTLLPGMKLGVDTKAGITRNITAWRSPSDPSPGDVTFKLGDGAGVLPQFILYRDNTPIYTSGPWNGAILTGVQNLTSPYFIFHVVSNTDETYYSYSLRNESMISRFVVDGTAGELRRFIWTKGEWQRYWHYPYDTCDAYAKCGPFGYCNTSQSPLCTCLPGFEPRSPQQWSLRDWSGGCIRSTKLSCGTGDDRFNGVSQIKLPDATNATVDTGMTLDQCKEACLNNCSCQAYAAANVNMTQGCVIWAGDLLDIRQNPNVQQNVYIRLAQSQTSGPVASVPAKNQLLSKSVLIGIAVAATVFGVLLLAACCCWFWRSKATKKNHSEMALSEPSSENDVLPFKVRMRQPSLSPVRGQPLDEDQESVADKNVDLPPLFDLEAILDATNNFAEHNKIGEGGFGPVYKGKLQDGQLVAVKKLAQGSMQGAQEFMTEVTLIAKLQHRNLVRLLGCCIDDDERMLVYEYMRNQSLDIFIFDEGKRRLLSWHKRFEIILGIARGLQYLHEDSRFRIIHRDLKASNVLLDGNMIPKISDFGIARMFGGDQTTAYTRRVVGTYGYMSPEYAMDGVISMKSDVFSFGVLVLEIITGKRNRRSFEPEQDLNLLGYAWMMWRDGRAVDLVDEVIGGNFHYKVLRCIQVALLCVQGQPRNRPLMSAIVMMLASENAMLPEPNEPGVNTCSNALDVKSLQSLTANYVTVTSLEGR